MTGSRWRGGILAPILCSTAAMLSPLVAPALAAGGDPAAQSDGDVQVTASPDAQLGDEIQASATVDGTSDPNQVTFDVYGPADPDCTGTPAFTDTAAASSNGDYVSDTFAPDEIGNYRWTASPGGNANIQASGTGCGASETSVMVAAPAQTPTGGPGAPPATATPGFDTDSAGTSVSSDEIGDLGGQSGRITANWCDINPGNGDNTSNPDVSGNYSKAAIQSIITQVGNAHNHDPSYTPVVNLRTSAPNYAKGTVTVACQSNPAIASGFAADYGVAARTLMFCLKRVSGPQKCPWGDDPASGGLTYPDGAGGAGSGVMGWVWGLEVGNEPNLDTWWCKQSGCQNVIQKADTLIFANAVWQAATKIHTYSPSLKVASGGLSFGQTDTQGCWGCTSVPGWDYLGQMYTDFPNLGSDPDGIDAVAIHPYGPGSHPSFDPGCYGSCETHVRDDIADIRFIMNASGSSADDIWITEVGVDTNYPPEDNTITSAEEAQQSTDLQNLWETITYYCGGQNRVTLALFWELADDQKYPPTGNAAFYDGFMRRSLSTNAIEPKPAYNDFKNWGIFGQKLLAFNTCA